MPLRSSRPELPCLVRPAWDERRCPLLFPTVISGPTICPFPDVSVQGLAQAVPANSKLLRGLGADRNTTPAVKERPDSQGKRGRSTLSPNGHEGCHSLLVVADGDGRFELSDGAFHLRPLFREGSPQTGAHAL